MLRSKRNFEQIPIDVVRRIMRELHEKKQSGATCPICGKDVLLETCKIDEYGQGIHEDCAVARLVSNHCAAPESRSSSQAH